MQWADGVVVGERLNRRRNYTTRDGQTHDTHIIHVPHHRVRTTRTHTNGTTLHTSQSSGVAQPVCMMIKKESLKEGRLSRMKNKRYRYTVHSHMHDGRCAAAS